MKKTVAPYIASAEVLSENIKLSIAPHAVKAEKHLAFTCDLDEIGNGKILVGHGKDVSGSSWLEISGEEIKAYTYYSYEEPQYKELLSDTAHGLQVKGFLSVIIDSNPLDKTSTFFVCTSTGMIKRTVEGWDGINGEIFAESVSINLRNCKLAWFSEGFSRKIWILGDSYSGISKPNRWPYYLYRDGFNCNMISGFPGMTAEEAIAEFRYFVKKGTPEFAVWTLGMNNPDTDGKINQNYLSSTEEFLNICQKEGITPILATVPNVELPYNNIEKNKWVRSQQYRYIDFARAVGSNDSPNWYQDMLSCDRVHPDIKGAQALYSQVLCDFPEIMQRNNI